MPKTKISEFSATPGNNTDIDGINIAEGCAPSGINDAIRELMAQLKDFQAGTAGDSFNGPVGTTTAAAGAFTNLSASGTFALTGDQVQISEGGTGQTTANAAFNALAPSQTSNAGKYLKTDGTNTSWDTLDISTADITGTLPVANGGTGVTSSTGTGSVVLSASPTFTGTVNGAALTLSSNFTLSGGTANGVAYLNGSKVLTTGSALSFDGTNFRAVSNARIEGTGIGITGSGDGAEIYSNSGVTYFQGVNRTSSTYIPVIVSGGTYIAQTLGGSEQMRLTTTGLGIGTSSPGEKLQVAGAIRATGAVAANTTGGILAYQGSSTVMLGSWGADASTYGAIQFYQANSTGTLGRTAMLLDTSGNLGLGTTTPTNSGGYSTLSLNGSTGGQLVFQTGGTYRQAIYSSSTDLNFYNQAAGNLAFFTNATERARITGGGNLLVGTTTNNASGGVIQVSNGITFPATQSASSDANTLDDYEEGTWTPSLTIGGGSVTYTTQTGTYTKVGRLVTVQIRIKLATVSTPSSYIVIQNPPFTMTGNDRGAGAVWVTGATSGATTTWMVQTRPANNDFYLVTYAAGAIDNAGSYLQANTEIQITASYEV